MQLLTAGKARHELSADRAETLERVARTPLVFFQNGIKTERGAVRWVERVRKYG